MRKTVKKTKKKTPTEKQPDTSSSSKPEKWTPIQQEQIDLAQQLDAYISEFQTKLSRLNFQPSNRELVILFMMNLHPRWRRLLEPLELSCNTWVEAAAFARLHCGRVSAILGCETSEPIFKTAEARALRDSGYFTPEVSPAKRADAISAIQHLLISKEDEEEKEQVVRDSHTHILSQNKPYRRLSFMDQNAEILKEKLPVIEIQEEEQEKEEQEEAQASLPSISTSESPNPQPSTSKTQKKDKKTKTNQNSKSICYRVPTEHSGVNLTFLELTINHKKVKGLLAKVHWGSSAISLDCVHRLGLSMKETDNFCINTDFGFEDSIGILTLPIVHPADSSIQSEMEIQVLPQIYGGKIDLVLGADFFYFYNPTLNIRTRAIRFLEKETPYIVSKIE